MSYIKKILLQIFSLDLRSLAMMRILLWLFLFIDLCIICSNFSTFIGDYGLFPPSLALSSFPQYNLRSFHTISGSYRWQIPLFTLHFIIVISFILWFKTKRTTPLLRAFTCSLQWSQHIFLYGGDAIARMLLFWSVFLPIGNYFSIDSKRKTKDDSKHYQISNIASAWYIIQICSLYFRSALLKNHSIWNHDYLALYYSLNAEYYSSSIGVRLRQYFNSIKFMSRSIYYLELVGWILYLLPFKIIKLIIVGLFIIFHLWIIVTMDIWIFPWICIAGLVGLIPLSTDNRKIWKHTYYHDYHLSSLKKWFLCIIIVFIFLRNRRPINNNISKYFPYSLDRFAYLLRIDQYWWMFAPTPPLHNWWHQINWIYYSNEKVNLSNPKLPPYSEKPPYKDFQKIHWTSKMLGYLTSISKESYSGYRPRYIQYLCKKRNWSHYTWDHIKSVEISYMRQDTKPNYENWPVQSLYWWKRDCINP